MRHRCVARGRACTRPPRGRRVSHRVAVAPPLPLPPQGRTLQPRHGRGPRLSSALRNVGHGSVERGRTGKLSEDATGSAIRVGAGGSTDR